MLRFVSLTLLALSLSGCGMLPFESPDSIDQPKPFPTTLGVSIPPSQAMAAMPIGAGQVIAVVEKRRGNAMQHEITLAGAPPNFGENQIVVTAFRYVDSSASNPIEDTLPTTRPTEAEVYEEMLEKIPGGALPTSNAVPRNGMGAFGYAFGRRNGANCLYAWQWIDAQGPRNFHPIHNKSTAAPMSVRVRICRPGMTEEVLVDLVRQMYVTPRYDDSYRGYPQGGQPSAMGGGRMMPGGLAAGNMSTGGGYRQQQGYGTYATGYGEEEYGRSANKSYNYPKYATPVRQQETYATAPVRRTVVRKVVKRRVPASNYSYTQAAPVQSVPTVGGYAAVPMPQ